MNNLTKKGKLIALVGALALICVTSVATMYFTGVLSSQGKGEYVSRCWNKSCSCHYSTFMSDNKCGKCSKCFGTLDPRIKMDADNKN